MPGRQRVPDRLHLLVRRGNPNRLPMGHREHGLATACSWAGLFSTATGHVGVSLVVVAKTLMGEGQPNCPNSQRVFRLPTADDQ